MDGLCGNTVIVGFFLFAKSELVAEWCDVRRCVTAAATRAHDDAAAASADNDDEDAHCA